MCKECYAKDCQCKCFFEWIPTVDILSDAGVEVCLKCAHERDRDGDYEYDQYEENEAKQKEKERAKNENRK